MTDGSLHVAANPNAEPASFWRSLTRVLGEDVENFEALEILLQGPDRGPMLRALLSWLDLPPYVLPTALQRRTPPARAVTDAIVMARVIAAAWPLYKDTAGLRRWLASPVRGEATPVYPIAHWSHPERLADLRSRVSKTQHGIY